MEKNKVVIIGAGQTGRGFIAPFVKESEKEIVFIDKNPGLISKLNEEGKYEVSYCGNASAPVIIDQYSAYELDSTEAIKAINESDLVLTAVGGDNINELVPLMKRALDERNKSDKLTLVCCENGIDVKRPLIDAEIDAAVTEGIIFCTTLAQDKNSLDLLTELYPNIPYDAAVSEVRVDVKGYIPEMRFSDLIQRKIYTYNCLSAFISYIGAYKKYEVYGEAANDEDISYLMEKALTPLNKAISLNYGIPLEEQTEFSKLAIKKFENTDIVDTISRNARDVLRKMGPTERLIRPLRLIKKYELDDTYMLIVIAAAMYYAKSEGTLKSDTLEKVSGISDLPDTVKRVKGIFNQFVEGATVKDIIEFV